MSDHTQRIRRQFVINADEAYELNEFRSLVKMKDFAFREARAAGLRVIPVGKNRYVLGKDWIRFLEEKAEKAQSQNA